MTDSPPITRRAALALTGAGLMWRVPAAARSPLPTVSLSTPFGDIEIDVDTARAPITAKNFLRYVTLGLYEGGCFYRVVRPDNDHNPATFRVVQGGRNADSGSLPPIAHEGTRQTGLLNLDGILSMARNAPGTATSEFSISIGTNAALDEGGERNPDGKGFAAFAHVRQGMHIVRRINGLRADAPTDDPYLAGQMLNPTVPFLAVRLIRG